MGNGVFVGPECEIVRMDRTSPAKAAMICAMLRSDGPSRELDAKIATLLSNSVESDDGDFWWGRHGEPPQRVPDFTTLVDVAVALLKAKIPDATWVAAEIGFLGGVYQDGKAGAGIRRAAMSFHEWHFAATPAMAICLAAVENFSSWSSRS